MKPYNNLSINERMNWDWFTDMHMLENYLISLYFHYKDLMKLQSRNIKRKIIVVEMESISYDLRELTPFFENSKRKRNDMAYQEYFKFKESQVIFVRCLVLFQNIAKFYNELSLLCKRPVIGKFQYKELLDSYSFIETEIDEMFMVRYKNNKRMMQFLENMYIKRINDFKELNN